MISFPQFPLVDRELIQAGRNVRTYLSRTYLAIIAMVIMALFWVANRRLELDMLEQRPEVIGRTLAGLAMFFQYIVVLFAAPSMTVPLIIREKDERTLPLLLLIGRRYWDVIVAKYVSVMVQVVMLILAILPLQALAALFGGINVAGLALQTALILLVAAAVSALSLMYSTVCKSATTAIALVYSTLVLWFLGTFWVDRVGLGAMYTNIFVAIPGAGFYGTLGSARYPALALPLVLAIGALARATYLLPRQVLHAPVAKAPVRPRRIRRTTGNGLRRLIISGAEGLGMADRSIVLRLLAFAGLCIIARIPFVGWLMIVVTFLWATTRGFGQLRSSGALEELLLTPQEDRSLATALVTAAISRSAFFVFPAALSIVDLPSLPGIGFYSIYEESPREFWLWISLLLIQFPLCAAIAAYALTISRPLRSLERYANLLYILGVIFPFLLPYVCAAVIVTVRRQFYDANGYLTEPSVALTWALTVSISTGLAAYFFAIRRIRVKIAAGPPPTRENPLLALLRP